MSFSPSNRPGRSSRSDRGGSRYHPYEQRKSGLAAVSTSSDSLTPPLHPKATSEETLLQALQSDHLPTIAAAFGAFNYHAPLTDRLLKKLTDAIHRCLQKQPLAIETEITPKEIGKLLHRLQYFKSNSEVPAEVYSLLATITHLIKLQQVPIEATLTYCKSLQHLAPHPAVSELLSALAQHIHNALYNYTQVADALCALQAHSHTPEAHVIIGHIADNTRTIGHKWERMNEDSLVRTCHALAKLAPSPQRDKCLQQLYAALQSAIGVNLTEKNLAIIIRNLGKMPKTRERNDSMKALYQQLRDCEDKIHIKEITMMLRGSCLVLSPDDETLCKVLHLLQNHLRHQHVDQKLIKKAITDLSSLPRGYKRSDESLDSDGLSQLDRRIIAWLDILTNRVKASHSRLTIYTGHAQPPRNIRHQHIMDTKKSAFCANYLTILFPMLFDGKSPPAMKKSAYTLLHTLFNTYEIDAKWLDKDWLRTMHDSDRLADVLLGILGHSHHRDTVPSKVNTHSLTSIPATLIYDNAINRFCKYGQKKSKLEIVCGRPHREGQYDTTRTLSTTLKTCLDKAGLEQRGIKVTWQQDQGAVTIEKINP